MCKLWQELMEAERQAVVDKFRHSIFHLDASWVQLRNNDNVTKRFERKWDGLNLDRSNKNYVWWVRAELMLSIIVHEKGISTLTSLMRLLFTHSDASAYDFYLIFSCYYEEYRFPSIWKRNIVACLEKGKLLKGRGMDCPCLSDTMGEVVEGIMYAGKNSSFCEMHHRCGKVVTLCEMTPEEKAEGLFTKMMFIHGMRRSRT